VGAAVYDGLGFHFAWEVTVAGGMVLLSAPELLHLLSLSFLEAEGGEKWTALLYPYDMALGPSALPVLVQFVDRILQKAHFGILLGLSGLTAGGNCSSLVAAQTSWDLSMS
jgi:hypothetical protein